MRYRLKLEPLEPRLPLTARLAFDLNVAPNGVELHESAAVLDQDLDFAYLSLTTASQGRELWRTDGGIAGTSLVKDIIPGNDSSAPRELTIVGDRVFFASTTDQRFGTEALWVSDGSETGTRPLLNLTEELANASVFAIEPWRDGVAVLLVRQQFNGNLLELWTSDGTPGGTQPVPMASLVVEQDAEHPAGADLQFTTALGSVFLVLGQRVWRSDGQGMHLVRDFSMDDDVQALELLPDEDRLWIRASTSHDSQLWIQRSTTATVELVETYVGQHFSLHAARRIDNRLYFALHGDDGDSRIGSSNGIDVGTFPLSTGPLTSPEIVGTFAGELFVRMEANSGTELKRITPATHEVHDVFDLEDIGRDNGPRPLMPFIAWQDAAYFVDHRADGAGVLYRFDFDTGVESLMAFAEGIAPRLRHLNEHFLFVANDGVHGDEIWRSDGTTVGTQLVSDLVTGTRGSGVQSKVFLDDGTMVYTTGGFIERRLWALNGDATSQLLEGTHRVVATHSLGHRALVGIIVQPELSEPFTFQVWSTDGTVDGTHQVFAIDNEFPVWPAGIAGGQAFYTLDSEEFGRELWVTDGTSAGTRLVLDILPGPIGSDPRGITAVGGVVYFQAASDLETFQLGTLTEQVAVNRELWRSDGTAEGTYQVADLFEGSGLGADSLPFGFAAGESHVYFFARSTTQELALWKSDGTALGTEQIDAVSIAPRILWADDDRVVYVGLDEPHSGLQTVWLAGGGSPRQPLLSLPTPAVVSVVDLHGDLFLLTSTSDESALWRSDGTPAGTRVIRRFDFDFSIQFAPSLADLVVFRHVSSTHGWEVWSSDGTERGTVLYDIHEGRGSSAPIDFVLWEDELYFTADDGITGAEVWNLDQRQPFAGDIDGDGRVSFDDFVVFAAHFGRSVEPYQDGDITGDGHVNFADFILFAESFGRPSRPLVARTIPMAGR